MIRELSDSYRFFVLSLLIFFAPQKDPEHYNYWVLQFNAGLQSKRGTLSSILTQLKQKAPIFQFCNGLPIVLHLPCLARKMVYQRPLCYKQLRCAVTKPQLQLNLSWVQACFFSKYPAKWKKEFLLPGTTFFFFFFKPQLPLIICFSPQESLKSWNHTCLVKIQIKWWIN